MFKVGDKVRRVSSSLTCIKVGDIGTILYIDHLAGDLRLKEYGSPYTWYNISKFLLVIPKFKPIFETDFLDCFQQNFKDGV